MSTTRRLFIALMILAATACPCVRKAHAQEPTLFVPQRPESITIDSPAAPMLIPGRPNPGDSLRRSSTELAREQYAVGVALESQGIPAAAISAYRNAVKLDPKIRFAHYRMGLLFERVQQHHAAALEFAAEVEANPGDRVAARQLGLALAQDGDTTRSITQLELLTRRDRGDTLSWRALGFAYGVAGRPRDAERALRRALALDDRDATTWRDLGAVLVASGRLDDARSAYGKAMVLAPRDPLARLNLGNLERRAKRYDAALAAYAQAIERDSTQALAYRGQITLLRALQRNTEAGAVYRRWLKVNPGESGLRMEAIQFFDELKRGDIALELARDGVRHAPRSGEARLAYGMALHAQGQWADALGELRRAEVALSKPEQRARVGALIRSMRASAPDSVRTIFAADSARFERAAADTSAAPR